MFKAKFIKTFILAAALYVLFVTFYASNHAFADSMNGFDLSNMNINRDEIIAGGPGRDGIPSINDPKFLNINDVNFLNDDDMVMSFNDGSITKAYPLRILIWHEIVNDTINKQSIAVTYCPLCGTGMVFDRNINGQIRSFGVSGLLYRSDVLMYDRETESLWSQLGMKGASGQAIDLKLKWLPSQQMTWAAWKKNYPNGRVLSTDTGYKRHYNQQAYASYFASDKTLFPVPQIRTELKQKSKVLGIIINGIAKAYPIKALAKAQQLEDQIADTRIIINYNNIDKSASVTDSNGINIPFVESYWFAWQGFYPKTKIGLP